MSISLPTIPRNLPPRNAALPSDTSTNAKDLAERRENQALLKAKLDDPSHPLTSEQSLALLAECILQGEAEARKVNGLKDVVICIGGARAGKSTLVNYLFGCKMQRVLPKKYGIHAPGKIVVVKLLSEGGSLDEITEIRHSGNSQTFLPRIVTSKEDQTICDTPGLLAGGCVEMTIASSVNIKRLLMAATSVKIILLINFNALRADKANGLAGVLKLTIDLFGSAANLTRYGNSVLFGVSHIPLIPEKERDPDKTLDKLKEWFNSVALEKPQQEVLNCLSQRLFIYDPLDSSQLEYSGALQRETILGRLDRLTAIQNPSVLFRTALSAADRIKLIKICEDICKKIQTILSRHKLTESNLTTAAHLLSCISKLTVIEHGDVTLLVANARSVVIDYFKGKIREFESYCNQDLPNSSPQTDALFQSINRELLYFDHDLQKEVKGLLSLSNRNETPESRLVAIHQDQDIQRLDTIRLFIVCANEDAQKLGKNLKQNLSDLSGQLSSTTDSLRKLVADLHTEDSQDRNRYANAFSLFELTKSTSDVLIQSARQCLEVLDKAATLGLESHQGVITVALTARKLAIDYLTEKLELLSTQQDHELEVFIKIHVGELKRETHQFEQFLQMREFATQRADAKFQQQLASLEQGFQAIQAHNVMSQEEKRIYEVHRRDMLRLKSDSGFDTLPCMDVQVRCDITEYIFHQLRQVQ